MVEVQYPAWIDDYAKAFHNAFVNMVPCSWGPVDFYAVLALLNGVGLAKIHEAVVKIKNNGVAMEEVAKCFPSPSSLRAAIYFAMVEYQSTEPKKREQFKETLEFLLNVLGHLIKDDLFALRSNIGHTKEEVEQILTRLPWQTATPAIARELGKFYNSAWSLVFALYRDFFPQDSHEIFGPYDASSRFGDNTISVIKQFPKIRPTELWPQTESLKHSNIKIYQVYKNVKFSCEIIGMHSLYEGDLINGLVAYVVEVDGKTVDTVEEMKELSNDLAQAATDLSSIYDQMDQEELKKKALDWLCYQYVYFFRLAGMNWQPTKEMFVAVAGKSVPERFEMKVAPTYEQYANSPDFEVCWLKDLYKK